MKKVVFMIIFAAYVLLVTSGCSVTNSKNGCPGANSNGLVPGKFKGG